MTVMKATQTPDPFPDCPLDALWKGVSYRPTSNPSQTFRGGITISTSLTHGLELRVQVDFPKSHSQQAADPGFAVRSHSQPWARSTPL